MKPLKPVQGIALTAVNQKLTDIEAENVKLKEQLQANTEQGRNRDACCYHR